MISDNGDIDLNDNEYDNEYEAPQYNYKMDGDDYIICLGRERINKEKKISVFLVYRLSDNKTTTKVGFYRFENNKYVKDRDGDPDLKRIGPPTFFTPAELKAPGTNEAAAKEAAAKEAAAKEAAAKETKTNEPKTNEPKTNEPKTNEAAAKEAEAKEAEANEAEAKEAEAKEAAAKEAAAKEADFNSEESINENKRCIERTPDLPEGRFKEIVPDGWCYYTAVLAANGLPHETEHAKALAIKIRKTINERPVLKKHLNIEWDKDPDRRKAGSFDDYLENITEAGKNPKYWGDAHFNSPAVAIIYQKAIAIYNRTETVDGKQITYVRGKPHINGKLIKGKPIIKVSYIKNQGQVYCPPGYTNQPFLHLAFNGHNHYDAFV